MVFLVQMVMAIAPYGVATLMAKAVSQLGIDVILALGVYCFTVILGLLMHLGLVYLPVAWYSTGKGPIEFLGNIREAVILAFSTSSSSATLPVTMKCVEQNVGIPNKTTSFVLPLGATINMDGTALYQGVAVVFISQVFGYDLGFGDLINIVLMATLASVGAAGVPGAGMITLVMVLDSVSPALVGGVAIVMGVDRFLDMMRTAVNVIGDSTATAFMHKISGGSSPEPKPVSSPT
jgi:Na+/H+-dicarboxylate symporter